MMIALSDTVQIAMIASAAPTIAAFAALIVGILNGRKANVIVGHVNSAASAAVAKIEGLQREVADLRASISDQRQTAALLAQSAATDTKQQEPK